MDLWYFPFRKPLVLFLLLLNGFLLAYQPAVAEKDQPSGLTINFLAHADQVFLNGYPVNAPLDEAVFGHENFQFAEIGQRQPFFGWIVNSEQDNTLQTAYRILVASSPDSLEKNQGNLWDSGKVTSNRSVNVYYEGKPLMPDMVCFWKVKTWDNQGLESSYSSVRQFKMAGKLSGYATARYPLQKKDDSPVSVKMLSDSLCFADFGKDAFGRLRLTLCGKANDDTITVHLGEALKKGRIDPAPGGTIRYSSYKLALKSGWNTYVVAIRPDTRNMGPQAVKMPEYIGEVTPFRYCEIEGYDARPTSCQIIRETVTYPFDDTDSYFHSSDSVLNQVWDLCKYSIKATSFTGIFIDGDRERIPYEADAYIDQLGCYGIAREYSIARYSREYLISHATWPTEWILQSVLMAWYDYLYTGNKESLEYFYPDLKAKTLMPLAGESGLISTRTGRVTPELLCAIHLNGTLKDIVDWPQTGILGLGKNEPGETDGFVFRDVNTVVNAYHYKALEIMSQVAEVLGKTDESNAFAKAASTLKKNFNARLLDPKRRIYVDGIGTGHASLHANLFPLAFGLVPDKDTDEISSFIQSRGMACSVYGSQFLLDAVYEGNNARYGLDLLNSTSERSWYNMIRAGSTITMEAWDNKYKPNQDWNHAWGAAPANIIPRKLMGIEPLEPGFRKIQIKPRPGSLRQAEIKCPTIRGDVMISFKNDPEKSFALKITIPANSTADVYLPFRSSSQKVTMNGEPASFHRDGGYVVIENVGSGSSTFNIVP